MDAKNVVRVLILSLLAGAVMLALVRRHVDGQEIEPRKKPTPTPISKPKPKNTTPKPTSTPGASTKITSNGIEFVQIPAGEFVMGSKNGFRSEQPVHIVLISHSFEMGKYEVTQAQWEAVTGNNPSHFKFKGVSLPVENVSWDDAQAFISALNSRNDGYVYRLPNEAEWEYAAREGTTGDFDGNFDEIGWYNENAGNQTHPVGQKQPNAFGLFDMVGNVAEWCQDKFDQDYYNNSSVDDPQGPTDGSVNVVRGCAYDEFSGKCEFPRRFNLGPSEKAMNIGLRLVRTSKTLTPIPTNKTKLSPKIYIEKGDVFANNNKWVEAEAAYRLAISLEPNNPIGHHKLYTALNEQHDSDNAKEEFDQFISGKWEEIGTAYKKAISLAPRDPRNYAMLAETLERQQKPADALAQYQQAIKLSPSNVKYHWRVCQLLYWPLNKNSEAEAECKAAIKFDPNDIQKHIFLSMILSNEKKYDEAARAAEQAIKLNFKDITAHIALGNVFQSQQKYTEAEDEFRKATMINPEDSRTGQAHISLVWLFERQGRIAEAETEIREAITVQPYSPFEHSKLGEILAKQLKYDEAEAEYREAIELNQPDTDTGARTESNAWVAALYRSELGGILAKQLKYDEAEAEYREATKLQPKSIDYLGRLGAVLEEQHKYAEAETEYRKAIQLQPDNMNAGFGLGRVLEKQHKYAEAETEYRQIVKLRPNDPNALNNLGYFLVEYSSKLDEALALLTRAVSLAPTDGYNLDSLGWAYFKREEFDKAERYLLEATRYATTSVIYDHLGDVFQKSTKFDSARQAWQKALTLSNDPEEIARLKAKLGDR